MANYEEKWPEGKKAGSMSHLGAKSKAVKKKVGSGAYEEGKNGRMREKGMAEYMKGEKDFEKKKKELYG